jgi:hypothetical protein
MNKRIYERSKDLIKKLREELTEEEFEKKVTKIINLLRTTNELTINLEIFSHAKITVNVEDASIEEEIIEIIFEEYVSENNLNNFKLELEKESFQFDTINHEGKIIIPEWYKSDKITYILLKNVDKTSKNSIAMKQLKTLIKECSIREKEQMIDLIKEKKINIDYDKLNEFLNNKNNIYAQTQIFFSKEGFDIDQISDLFENELKRKELSKDIHFIIISNRDLVKEYIIETEF